MRDGKETIFTPNSHFEPLLLPGRREWGPGRVLPEKLGGRVRPASQNPYPIYDQNLRHAFPTVFVT